MHSLRQFFLLCHELCFPPPEFRNFRIVEMGAELLKSIHFPLHGSDVALDTKLLQFPGTTERRSRRLPFGRDACNEMSLHRI